MSEQVHLLLVKGPDSIHARLAPDPLSAEYHADEFRLAGHPAAVLSAWIDFSEPGAKPRLNYKAAGPPYEHPAYAKGSEIRGTLWHDLRTLTHLVRRIFT